MISRGLIAGLLATAWMSPLAPAGDLLYDNTSVGGLGTGGGGWVIGDFPGLGAFDVSVAARVVFPGTADVLTIDEIEVGMIIFGGGFADDIIVSIHQDAQGLPGAVLASSSTFVSSTPAFAWFGAPFAQVPLQPNVPYWISVAAADLDNTLLWKLNSNLLQAPMATKDVGTGGLWVLYNPTEQVGAMRIYGTEVPQTFCTSKPSSIPGCVPDLMAPSSTISKGGGPGSYDLTAAPVPGGPGQLGILIFTANGLLASPLNTVFGELCLSQFLRVPIPASPGGNSGVCDGAYQWDFGGFAATQPSVVPGTSVHIQAWYRDPPSTGGANLTQGIGPISIVP